ncbi:N-succinylarginine dihydrolase [Escherichia coli]|nr:N-succinylarginine dihydrolase [Escherichia coli]
MRCLHICFNSQLLSRDDGSMMLVLPQECREHAGVWGYLNELLAADNPISELKVFDLRESMANGGGPACLRLRVVLTQEERRAVNPAVMMNDTLFNALNELGGSLLPRSSYLLPIWPTAIAGAKGGKHWMY